MTAATFGGLQGSGDFSLPAGFSLSVGGNGFLTTFSGQLSGSGSFVENGPGELDLTADNSDFGGTTTVLAGILDAESPSALPGYSTDDGSVSVETGGTLAVGLNSADPWSASQITGLLTSGNLASGSNLGIDTGGGSVSYDDTELPSNLGLVVLGSGTLALTGDNTSYSEGTTVLGAATLQVGSSSCLGASSGTISLVGGTLQATGDLDLSAPIVLSQGATIDTNGCTVDSMGKSQASAV